jgi:hypothetical protein
MADAEDAILAALESTLLNPAVLEAAISRAVEHLIGNEGDDESAIVVELRALESQLARLGEAVAQGGNIPTLLEEIQKRESDERPSVAHSARPRNAPLRPLRKSWQIFAPGSTTPESS